MTLSDDTTTIPNFDADEDKMQILSRRELREYFETESRSKKKLSGSAGGRVIRYIKKLFS